MTMSVKHGEVLAQVGVLQSIIDARLANIAQIRSVTANLHTAFLGDGATGHEAVMARLGTQTDQCDSQLQSLRRAIATAAQMIMDQDHQNGLRFQV
ncbi:hypothetical protein [Nocardia colli]|uniref:hypothetical protein n=1 Tax=Nocardia colli TaxID=2545717 RepID=UPI0035D94386